MPVISKEEARRQYSELTGTDGFRNSYAERDPGGGLHFISAESEAEAESVQNRLPNSYGSRRRKQDDGHFEVAIYEKPETREEGKQVRSKIRNRWGSLR